MFRILEIRADTPLSQDKTQYKDHKIASSVRSLSFSPTAAGDHDFLPTMKMFYFYILFFKYVSISDFSDDKHLIQSVFWLCKNFLPLLIYLFLANNSSSTASVPSLTLLPPACCPCTLTPPRLTAALSSTFHTMFDQKKQQKKKNILYILGKKRNKSVFCC